MAKNQKLWERIRVGNPVVFLICTVIIILVVVLDLDNNVGNLAVPIWCLSLIFQIIAYYKSGKSNRDIERRKEYKEKLKNNDKELLAEIKRRKAKSLAINKITILILLIILLRVGYKCEGRPNYIRKLCAERSVIDNRAIKGLREDTGQKEYYYSDCVTGFGVDETDQRHYDGDFWTDLLGI